MIGARWGKTVRVIRIVELMDCLTALKGLAEGLERSGPPLASLVQAPPTELKPGLERVENIWPAASELAAPTIRPASA